MESLEHRAVARRASRLATAGLIALIPLVTAAGGASPPAPSAPPAAAPDPLAAAATLPGHGPLPARVPLALLKAHQGTATLDDAIDQCVTQSMATAGTPGASVAVAMDGALTLERGYGIFLADLDEDGELDSDFEFIERGAPERAGCATGQWSACDAPRRGPPAAPCGRSDRRLREESGYRSTWAPSLRPRSRLSRRPVTA